MYGYCSVRELTEVPGIVTRAYRTQSFRAGTEMLHPYPWYCGTGRTEPTEVPGTGTNVLQNSQKFRVETFSNEVISGKFRRKKYVHSFLRNFLLEFSQKLQTFFREKNSPCNFQHYCKFFPRKFSTEKASSSTYKISEMHTNLLRVSACLRKKIEAKPAFVRCRGGAIPDMR